MGDATNELEAKRRENTSLWDAVSVPPPKYTKRMTHGAKLTSVDAMWVILRATEMWGPFGVDWRLENEGWEIVDCEKFAGKGKPKESAKSLVYWGTVMFPPSGRSSAIVDLPYLAGDDVFKKAQTQVVSKALSRVGFASSVYLGHFDDQSFVRTADFASKHADKKYGIILGAIEAAADENAIDTLRTKITTNCEDGILPVDLAKDLQEHVDAKELSLAA